MNINSLSLSLVWIKNACGVVVVDQILDAHANWPVVRVMRGDE